MLEVENTENGIKLTFLTNENKKITGIYNLGKLSLEDLKRLVGNDIAFSDEREMHITKAWTKTGRPIYCDDPFHVFDR